MASRLRVAVPIALVACLVPIVIAPPALAGCPFLAETDQAERESIFRNQVFGSSGTAPGAFDTPHGVALDEERGRIIVSDRGNHRIQVFDLAGRFLFAFGQAGSGPGFLSFPGGITIGETGEIVVADSGNDRVQRFHADGGWIDSFGEGSLRHPMDVAIGAGGEYYVADRFHNRIARFDAAGTFELAIGGPGDEPGDLSLPEGVDLLPGGEVVVSDTGHDRLVIFHRNGKRRSSIGEHELGASKLDDPGGVAVDDRGRIHVADRRHSVVKVFNESGMLLSVLGHDSQSMTSVRAVDVVGDRLVAAAHRSVEVWTLHLDADGDGSGLSPMCDQEIDCDDSRADVYPGAVEQCDGRRNDCRTGSAAEPPADEFDRDGDGFLACADCVDSSDRVFPGAPQLCDGRNNDCLDPAWPVVPEDEREDRDGDGFVGCAECDDSRGSVYPGAPELCNGLDDDCDQAIDEDAFGVDVDHDGVANLCDNCIRIPNPEQRDEDGDGYGAACECDDRDAVVVPGSVEICDNDRDDDCNGQLDETSLWLAGEFTFGERGQEPGQLNGPVSLAIDGAGRIVEVDRNNDRVQRFTADGTFLDAIGVSGSDRDQLSLPTDVALGPDGGLHVADWGNDRIVIFDADGAHRTTIGRRGGATGEFLRPTGVAVAPDGRIYVADFGNHRVQLFAPSGAHIATVGRFGTEEGQFFGPTDLAVSVTGELYVLENANQRVQVFDDRGTYLRSFGSFGIQDDQFLLPVAIALDAQDRVYVADANHRRVAVFDRLGRHLRNIGGLGASLASLDGSPHGVAVDSDGVVWVGDAARHRIVGLPTESFCVDGIVAALREFEVTRQKSGVGLRWTVAASRDHSWQIYRRAVNGRRQPIALLFDPLPAAIDALHGAEYRYLDESAGDGGLDYWLEAIDRNGEVTRFGPVTVEARPD